MQFIRENVGIIFLLLITAVISHIGYTKLHDRFVQSEKAVVSWYVLSSGARVYSAPLPHHEAVRVYREGMITYHEMDISAPSVYRQGTPEFEEAEALR